MSDFHIRRAGDGDGEQVIALVSEMFRTDATPRYEWLYSGNPHGKAATWLAVEEDGAAVALTSIFPRKVLVGGRERTGSIGGDCYVLPRVRRRGLATRLHRACFAEMHEAGVDFMYGPPLPNNLRALLKAGAREVGGFRRYTRPLTGEAAVTSLSRGRAPRALGQLAAAPLWLFDRVTGGAVGGLEAREVERFDERFDELARRAARPGLVCPLRDRAFLAWRYLEPAAERPTPFALERDGELAGFAALEIQGDAAIIVDLFAADPEVLGAGLQVLVDRARERGCAHVDFYATRALVPPRALTRRGFFPREERVFQCALGDGVIPERDLLLDPGAWYFTEGDKDSQTSFSAEPD